MPRLTKLVVFSDQNSIYRIPWLAAIDFKLFKNKKIEILGVKIYEVSNRLTNALRNFDEEKGRYNQGVSLLFSSRVTIGLIQLFKRQIEYLYKDIQSFMLIVNKPPNASGVHELPEPTTRDIEKLNIHFEILPYVFETFHAALHQVADVRDITIQEVEPARALVEDDEIRPEDFTILDFDREPLFGSCEDLFTLPSEQRLRPPVREPDAVPETIEHPEEMMPVDESPRVFPAESPVAVPTPSKIPRVQLDQDETPALPDQELRPVLDLAPLETAPRRGPKRKRKLIVDIVKQIPRDVMLDRMNAPSQIQRDVINPKPLAPAKTLFERPGSRVLSKRLLGFWKSLKTVPMEIAEFDSSLQPEDEAQEGDEDEEPQPGASGVEPKSPISREPSSMAEYSAIEQLRNRTSYMSEQPEVAMSGLTIDASGAELPSYVWIADGEVTNLPPVLPTLGELQEDEFQDEVEIPAEEDTVQIAYSIVESVWSEGSDENVSPVYTPPPSSAAGTGSCSLHQHIWEVLNLMWRDRSSFFPVTFSELCGGLETPTRLHASRLLWSLLEIHRQGIVVLHQYFDPETDKGEIRILRGPMFEMGSDRASETGITSDEF